MRLDTFDTSKLAWPWTYLARRDRALGFRSDKRLVSGYSRPGRGEWVLRVVSVGLYAVVTAIFGLAIWLLVLAHFSGPLVFGALALLGVAFWLRPRLGRVKPLVEQSFVVTEDKQPALFTLLRGVAKAANTPMPDVVGLSYGWNATAAVVGLRRRRVMTIGIPLFAALRPQERVALLAHEFGHLAHDDSMRQLLRQPALTYFGLLAEAVRAPKMRRPVGNPFYALWMVIGGVLAFLLSIVHFGLNVLGAREGRRAELRADLLAIRLAGSVGALGVMDMLACVPELAHYVGPSADQTRVMQSWHENVEFQRDRLSGVLPRLRQLTMRHQSGLLASHPAPGRRYEIVAGQPHQDPAVVMTQKLSDQIDAQMLPYAKAVRTRMQEVRYGI